MKGMLKFIKHVAEDLTKEMEMKAKESEEFELKDVFGKFSLDALASSAFGVDAGSFKNKDSIFVKYADNIFKHSAMEKACIAFKFIPGVAQLCSFLKINTFKAKETKFFRDIIVQTIRARKETKDKQNDLVDLMLDCIKDDVTIDVDDDEDEASDQYEEDMKLSYSKKCKQSMDELTVLATAIVLLVAGYDTTAMTLSYLAYELSKNPEVQRKLQDEIDQAYEESDGEIPDYNVIQSLPFLDMVIHETLRYHSPVGINTRIVTKDYILHGTDVVFKTNNMMSSNTKGLHFDPEHWTNPSEFYPEHFSKEAKLNEIRK
jgi:cytochrome P450